jgi:hypothetical protein
MFLRSHIMTQPVFESEIQNFMYGFTSSIIGVLLIISILGYIIFDINRKYKYNQTLEHIQTILEEQRHILPVYYTREWRDLIETKKMDQIESKPEIVTSVHDFIIPTIDTTVPFTPMSTPNSLKRRKNASEVFEIDKEKI